MGNTEFEEIAKELIYQFYKKHKDNWAKEIDLNKKKDIYTVWICKALGNNKGLFSTTQLDGKYFEITYNGDKNEIYFDTYLKGSNCVYVECPTNRYAGVKKGTWISQRDLNTLFDISKEITGVTK